MVHSYKTGLATALAWVVRNQTKTSFHLWKQPQSAWHFSANVQWQKKKQVYGLSLLLYAKTGSYLIANYISDVADLFICKSGHKM